MVFYSLDFMMKNIIIFLFLIIFFNVSLFSAQNDELMDSIRDNDIERIKILLRDGENLDLYNIKYGMSPLMYATQLGNIDIVNELLDFGAKDFDFSFCSGTEFPEDLTEYKLIIHCGGCMLNDKQMKSRLELAIEQNIPITNYGTVIAHINGILKRTLQPFENLKYNK